MMLTRRRMLALGGGVVATLTAPSSALGEPASLIEMRGTARGERVWFTPVGLAITPGTAVRFVNRDPVNSHTATAYHPELFSRQKRIPDGATPWNSGFLLPDQSFEVTLTVPGVYDYYCIPHENAGMAGRIVVGHPGDNGWQDAAPENGDVPPKVIAALPEVGDIVADERIHAEQR